MLSLCHSCSQPIYSDPFPIILHGLNKKIWFRNKSQVAYYHRILKDTKGHLYKNNKHSHNAGNVFQTLTLSACHSEGVNEPWPGTTLVALLQTVIIWSETIKEMLQLSNTKLEIIGINWLSSSVVQQPYNILLPYMG